MKSRRIPSAGQGDDDPHAAHRATEALARELSKPFAERDSDLVRALQAEVLVNEMFQFVGLVSTDGILLDANASVIAAGGLKRDDVIGLPVWKTYWWRFDAQIAAGVQDAIRRAAEGELVRYDVDVRMSRGNLRTIDFSAKPVIDRKGGVAFLVLEGRDIDEKKRAKAELENKNRQLEELAEKLRHLDEVKSRFFANVSHELRTPLTLILGPIEQVLAGDGDEQATQRRLRLAREQALHLRRRVDDLLDIARLDVGKTLVRYRRTDFARLLRIAASNFQPLASARAITFDTLCEPQLVCEIDPDQCFRILINLLSNAFKFTPAGGRIRCVAKLDPGGRNLLIEVADSGPGLAPEDRERVFERFEQAETGDTRKFGGTGLGLAIVKELALLHKGDVQVDTAPEGGALFQVVLPATAPAGAVFAATPEADDAEYVRSSQSAAAELRPRAVRHVSSPHMDRVQILVVEDNPDMQDYLIDLLSEHYAVAVAGNGREGLSVLRERRPDIVICDVMMPHMGGEQMIREMKNHPFDRDIPIVALTARVDDALRNRFFRLGVQDFVTKPFHAEDLLARLERLSRSGLLDSATRDPLTGVWNREKIEDFIDWQISRARRYTSPFSLLMLDIDNFKQVNDMRGHAEGDQVLQRLAATVGGIIRESDVLGRWGGEEFMVVVPEASHDDAFRLADKIRRAVEQAFTDRHGRITVSAGVAEFRKGETRQQLFRRVDSALYQAKDNGRNRVNVAH